MTTLRDRYRGCLLGGAVLSDLEGRDVIIAVADDLYDVFAEGQEPQALRYPAEPAVRR